MDEKYLLVGGNERSEDDEREYRCRDCGGPVWLRTAAQVKLANQPGGAAICLDCVMKIEGKEITVQLPSVPQIAEDLGVSKERAAFLRSFLFRQLAARGNKLKVGE